MLAENLRGRLGSALTCEWMSTYLLPAFVLVFQALAMSENAPKLMAILSAALGVREPQPIRKPGV